ncbi:Frataxin-like protein, mitochondrial [Erysiphe neolycopersici]|uniref:ferroxidase n=1 Tax=Erysiphe neolycopersici TaxID=212602 RepID=A0A420I4L5_9PEZI|nr:Frataxin-like protein, mitochondrial [Erysiphe neolycopersici]
MSRVRPSRLCHISALKSICRAPSNALLFNIRPNNVKARYLLRPHIYKSFTCTPQIHDGRSHKSAESADLSNETLSRAHSITPVELSLEQYHSLADSYLSELEEKFNELQENNELVDVEFSAGVLTLTLPPKGIYVLNKQPPNKQIWLASPVSGPKRYDYVQFTENSQQSAPSGRWVYLRDGSTLSDLLKQECQVTMEI